jgi:hypothetical protein
MVIKGLLLGLPEEIRDRINFVIDQKVLKYELKRKRLTLPLDLASFHCTYGAADDPTLRVIFLVAVNQRIR